VGSYEEAGTGTTKMIVDTSAIIAILWDEPEAEICARAIANSTDRRVSAVNYGSNVSD